MSEPRNLKPAPAPAPAQRPRIMTRALMPVCLASFGALTSLYLLLPVVPMYATSAGAGGIGAGLATGALMLTSVSGELVTPWLVARYGYRWVLVAGLVLLGAPALVLPGSASMVAILAVCVVRGLGFAIAVVACGALAASLLPPERRGEGLGLLGVVAGVPAVLGLPLGVWMADRLGYPIVFATGAVVALAAAGFVLGLPGRRSEPTSGPMPVPIEVLVEAPGDRPADQPLGVLAAMRLPAVVRPAIIFAATAMAAGIVVTFLPAAVGDESGTLVTVGLLVHAAVATFTRWWAGRYGDRHGAGKLLVPGVLVTAAGMLALVTAASPVAVLIGMVLGGAGFGVAQTASLAVMYERAPASGYDAVSAIWNMAYDAGWGLGGAGFGLLAVQAGYPAAFALTAALLPTMLVVAVSTNRSRAHTRRSSCAGAAQEKTADTCLCLGIACDLDVEIRVSAPT